MKLPRKKADNYHFGVIRFASCNSLEATCIHHAFGRKHYRQLEQLGPFSPCPSPPYLPLVPSREQEACLGSDRSDLLSRSERIRVYPGNEDGPEGHAGSAWSPNWPRRSPSPDRKTIHQWIFLVGGQMDYSQIFLQWLGERKINKR